MMDRRLSLHVAVFLLLVALVYRDSVLNDLLDPWERWTALVTETLLVESGVKAVRTGSVVALPGVFGYEIYYRCTGILPAATLSTLILGSAGTWRRKLLGIGLGASLLLILNAARLVHLFHIGVASPEHFHLAHRYFWEGAMMACVLGVWILWLGSGDGRWQRC